MHPLERATSFLDREPELWKKSVQLLELNRRFLWFLSLRFGVISALFVIALIEDILLPHLHINPKIIFVVAALLSALNVLYLLHYKWAITYHDFSVYTRKVKTNIQVQIIFDFLILGYFVYEFGGLESPLIYFFLFHNALSCLFFSRRTSFIHTMVSISIITTICLLISSGTVPERRFLVSAFTPAITSSIPFVYYYLAGVVSIYLTFWYLISTITESLKKQERRLQNKIQEMIDLAKEKTRYMLVTTHEIKGPFAAIQTYVNVALGGYAGEVSEKLKEILWKINARCSMISEIITDMLQLSNITSIKEYRREIVMLHINISQLISSVVRRFVEIAKMKEIEFEMGTIPFEHHFIEANSEEVDILLSNIIKNAVSYSYSGTKINLDIKESEQHVLVSVANKGIGVSEENLKKIFLEHFRTEKAVEMNPNSTGLGLTIARQIMDIHHGRIWIESEEGAVTTVFMEFPKSPK